MNQSAYYFDYPDSFLSHGLTKIAKESIVQPIYKLGERETKSARH